MFATASTSDWFEVLEHVLAEILGYHGCFYEDYFLLEFDAVQSDIGLSACL